MKKTILRAQYSYDVDLASEEAGLCCGDVSLTQQHQKDDADINVIVKRFGLTGQLPQGNVRPPVSGDFTGITTFQEAVNAVKRAEASFMAMPPEVRLRFKNDPEAFVEFCSDPKNLEEMVKLGLAVKKTVASPAVGDGSKAPTVPAPKSGPA